MQPRKRLPWLRNVLVALLIGGTAMACNQSAERSNNGQYEEENRTAPMPEEAESGEAGGEAPTARYALERDEMATADSQTTSAPPPPEVTNTEEYKNYGTNPWVKTELDHLSTFAIDVDTASYTIARRKLLEGSRPSPDAVRVEEFVNYFDYGYAEPLPGLPFGVDFDVVPSPFASDQKILRVGVQGQRLTEAMRKKVNLTFLVDVSGSMTSVDKLGLTKDALKLLVSNMRPDDTIALVTYAGNTSVVLQPTPVAQRDAIFSALDRLEAGGSTAMSSGLQLAYEQANRTLDPNAVNRVLVVSDGDANVGSTDHGGMLESIQHYVDEGITMSVIGVGMGNYKDTRMEQLANNGNGNYFYFDTMEEAKRVFVDELEGTLHVIAKDVKIQVDFDPSLVSEYRLIGYENRDIADDDFRDDKVDAGEIGAGHSVTALYEVKVADGAASGNFATVRIRHKAPTGHEAQENVFPLELGAAAETFQSAKDDTRFAVAVVAFAEHLRDSPHRAKLGLDAIEMMASTAIGQDAERQAFLELVRKAGQLDG